MPLLNKKRRNEYTLLKEVVSPTVTEVSNIGNTENAKNPVNTAAEDSGVISPLCGASMLIDTVSKQKLIKKRNFFIKHKT